ncbi:MAG TPA: adenylate kinase [Gemmatimonadota bacterium]|nr:adenylate kinase [Gemmatimonadota bacterium]
MARYLIVMGPPGAGKGTQAARLASGEGLCRIATGDILRAALAAGSPLGREAERTMKAGELVPDDVILRMVDAEIDRPACAQGAVFDGFPRTVEQARGLGELLGRRAAAVDQVIVLDVPEEEVVRRLSGRRVCKKCEKLYHVSFDPPREDDRCDACGGELVQRPDDRPETIRRRLAVYREETQPVREFYESGPGAPRKGLTEIAGDRSIDEVSAEIRGRVAASRVPGAAPWAELPGG